MGEFTYETWNLRIGDQAFSGVIPKELELEKEIIYHTTGFLWWSKEHIEETGKWLIHFTYATSYISICNDVKTIDFNSEATARWWFDNTYTAVFLKQKEWVGNPPKDDKPKDKKSGLKLV